jgi:hypothetical protein
MCGKKKCSLGGDEVVASTATQNGGNTLGGGSDLLFLICGDKKGWFPAGSNQRGRGRKREK